MLRGHVNILLAGLIGVALVGFILYSRTASADYVPASDFALIESYTIHAIHGKLSVGPYSRNGWHHPGPIYFYVLAPFYAMSGYRSAGLSATALAINVLSLTAIVGIPLWFARRTLAIVLALLVAAYIWRIQTILVSQWNAHVIVLPMMAFIVSASFVRRRGVLVPVLAAVATFEAQTYVGVIPAILAISVISTVITTVSSYRSDSRDRFHVVATLCVLLLLWAVPAVEEFQNKPGNVTRLWEFFASTERPGQPLKSAFSVWADMLSAVVRPDFARAWGDLFHSGKSLWAQACAVVQIVLLGVIAFRTKDEIRRTMAGLLLITSAIVLWSITRISDGDLYDHTIFWISGVGILNFAVILEPIFGRLTSRLQSTPVWLAESVCALTIGAACLIGFQQLRVVVSRSFRPGIEQLAARRLSDAVRGELLRRKIVPLIKIDPPTWAVTAGVLLEFQKTNVPFAVEHDWLWMFTDAAAATGRESHALIFATPQARTGLLANGRAELIAERDAISVLLTSLTR